MRTFILGVLLLLAIAIGASAQTSVKFNLQDPQFGISFTTNIQVVLQAEGVNLNGTVTLLPITLYGWTDTNGSVTFSNLGTATTLPGYYHFTVPANSNPQGNGPPQTYQGDIIITSTNLGTVSATSIAAGNGPTYPYGSGWSWSAQASDLRYNQTTNVLNSYVQIGQLNSASNAIVAQIPSTNGFISQANLAGLASTNYANNLTNNFTSIVFSNPASFTTPTQVSNLVNTLSTTNGIPAATATNIANGIYSNNPAGYLVATATNNAASTNYVNTAIINATNTLASTNLVATSIAAATNTVAQTNWVGLNFALSSALTAGTNQIATNQTAALNTASNALSAQIAASTNGLNFAIGTSNSLLLAKQPASAILTNLAVTGAFTNAIAAGQNFSLTTNFSGNTITLNATNQTFLTNGLGQWVGLQPSAYIGTNALPGLTNGFVGQGITNGLASIAYVQTLVPSLANTNQYAAGQNVSFTTNFSGNIISINATNQTGLTNGLGQWVGLVPSTFASTNQIYGLTNLIYTIGANATNFGNVVGLAGTNNVGAASNALWLAFSAAMGYSNAAVQANATGLVATASANLTNFVVATGAAGTNNTMASSNSLYQAFFAALAATNTANLTITTNLAIAATNAGNIVFTNNPIWTSLAANGFNYVTSSNGAATGLSIAGNLNFGTKTNFLISTNVIGIIGNAEGTYLGANYSSIWTNVFDSRFTIQQIGAFYHLYSNTNSLYQSQTITNWTQGDGALPVPIGAWGTKWHMNGVDLVGWVYSTNITAQINAAIAAQGAGTNAGTTNFILSGVVGGFTTNNSFSATGTNVIDAEIARLASNPTNGVTAATVTNIVTGMTNGVATTNYVISYVQVATNNLASIAYVQNSTNNFVGHEITNSTATLNFVTNYVAANGGSGGSATNAIGNNNGFGTNTTIVTAKSIGVTNFSTYGTSKIGGLVDMQGSTMTNASVVYVTNLVILGNANSGYGGSISFPGGDSIYENFPGTTGTYQANDSGISIGIGNGQIYKEQFSFVAGASNDIVGGGGTSLAVIGASIAGGMQNTIGDGYNSDGSFCFIGGGVSNKITSGLYNSIGGGSKNSIVITPVYGGAVDVGGDTISGGVGNTISGFSDASTVLGGKFNSIANATASVAMGNLANIQGSNVFIWNDGASGAFSNRTDNQFLIHSMNGVAININSAGGNALEVNGNVDSTVGYSINGTPISSLGNIYLGGVVAGTIGSTAFTSQGTNAILSIIGNQSSGGYVNSQSGLGTNESFYGTNLVSGVYFYQTNLVSYSTNSIITTNYSISANTNSILVYGAGDTSMNGTYTLDTNTYLPALQYRNGSSGRMQVGINVYQLFNYFGNLVYQSWNLTNNWYTYWPYGTPPPPSAMYIGNASTNYTYSTNVVISTNIAYQPFSQVAVGTNSAGTNALRVVGNVDSTVGFTVNGVPISSGGTATNFASGTVTNGSGTVSFTTALQTAGGVTNRATPNFVSVTVSNGTTATLNIGSANGFGVGSYIGPDNGNINLISSASGQVRVSNSGSANPMDYYGNYNYDLFNFGTYGGAMSQPYTAQVGSMLSQWTYTKSENFVYSMFQPMIAGSAAALDDLPINGDELRINQPYPPMTIVSSDGNAYSAFGENELRQTVANEIADGFLNAYTNAGFTPFIELQTNAKLLNTNRVQSYQQAQGWPSAQSALQINTNYFPSGTNIFKLLHPSGFRFDLQMNTYPYAVQNYVRDWLNSLSSNNSLQPAMTINTIDWDIPMLYSWGVDGITLADNTGKQGEYNLLTRKVASAILAPIIQHNYMTASRSDVKNQSQYLAPMSYRQYVQYLGCNSPQLLQSVNSINFDQGPNTPGYPYPGSITNNPDPAIYGMNWFRCIYTNYSTGIAYPPTAGFTLGGGGAIDPTPTNICQLGLATSAMLRGSTWVAMDYYHTNNTLLVAHPVLFPLLTNSYFISILKDMTARCYPVIDLGATNVSVWAKPLAQSSYAVWAFNESNGVANITVPLSAIGSTNQYWNVFDCFGLTNYSASPVNGTLALTLAATNGYLLELTPANTYSGTFTGNGAGLTNMTAQFYFALTNNIGVSTTSTINFSNNVSPGMVLHGNFDGDTEIAAWNHSPGANATASIYCIVSNGAPGVTGSNYLNIGMNGPNYSQGTPYFGNALDAYMFPVTTANGYANGGNMIVGTLNTNTAVMFSVGNKGQSTNAILNASGFSLLTGTFTGNGAGLTNYNATNLVGNVQLSQIPTGQGVNSVVTNQQQTANIGGTFTIQSSGNALKNAAGGQLIDSAGNITAPTASITNLAIGVPSGAAAGWVFTLTNTGTGQGTWSNAPAGGGTSFVPSTNQVVPVYAGADTGANNTNVVLDCSKISGTNIGAYFFLTVTNPTRLIFSNTVSINPGIGGYIYLSNNAAGGSFVTYTNTVSSLGQLSIAYWTNGSALNGIGFTVTPAGQIQIKSLDWGIQ